MHNIILWKNLKDWNMCAYEHKQGFHVEVYN